MEITEKAIEIKRKEESVFERMNVIEAVAAMLTQEVIGEDENLSKGQWITMLDHIGTTAKQCAHDFDSLGMEDLADIEASRML